MNIRPIDQKYCKLIMCERGPTYNTASVFFPKKIKERVEVLYAFLREPDDIVDELVDEKIKNKKLERWTEDWNQAWQNPDSAINPVLRSSSIMFKQYKINKEETEAFLSAMRQDLNPMKFPTLIELQKYMYGSAGVVGIMMTKLLVSEKKWNQGSVLKKAALLGDAMQLTNFLRDIESDYDTRQRIYFPQEIAKKNGIDESYFSDKKSDASLKKAIQETINLAQKWFDESEQGLVVFPLALRFPIKYSCRLYKSYLRQIEKSNGDIWGKDFSLTRIQKIKLLFSF